MTVCKRGKTAVEISWSCLSFPNCLLIPPKYMINSWVIWTPCVHILHEERLLIGVLPEGFRVLSSQHWLDVLMFWAHSEDSICLTNIAKLISLFGCVVYTLLPPELEVHACGLLAILIMTLQSVCFSKREDILWWPRTVGMILLYNLLVDRSFKIRLGKTYSKLWFSETYGHLHWVFIAWKMCTDTDRNLLRIEIYFPRYSN